MYTHARQIPKQLVIPRLSIALRKSFPVLTRLGIKAQIQSLLPAMVCSLAVKGFPDMRLNERSIEFIRIRDAVRTVGWLKRELNAFTGLQLFFTTSKQKIPTGRMALGDWLGCYRVESRVGILHNMESRNWPV